MSNYRSLFQKELFVGKKGIELLKAIEDHTGKLFVENYAFNQHHKALGDDDASRKKANHCVLTQSFEGVDEFSDSFYKLLRAAAARQDLCRQFVDAAFEAGDSGFNKFDTALIKHSGRIMTLYSIFYEDWARAVQGNTVATRLKEELEKGVEIDKALQNPYTIVQIDAKGSYYDVPYAEYFKGSLWDIIKAFDDAIVEIDKLKAAEHEITYVKYFRQYRACLAEKDKSKLEDMNRELDEIWMDLRCPIQIVHDIETGYGDPMRCKAIPDFSLRFVDSSYSKENQIIQEIQKVMLSYFGKRETALSKKGLFALQNSFAAIYYVPFQCGMSLHFRFSGQSIPNRPEVKDKKGVKIYFDPVSTAKRIAQTETLIQKVCAESEKLIPLLNPVDTIIYHVAAHEIGHAIYGLAHVKDVLTVTTQSILEEPRAELTALHTLRLLVESKYLTVEQATHHLVSFALQDLRRFAMFKAAPLRPYIVSALNCYKEYEKLGFVTRVDNGTKIKFHEENAMAFLKRASELFEEILACEDAKEGGKIEATLKTFEEEVDITKWLVSQLFTPN